LTRVAAADLGIAHSLRLVNLLNASEQLVQELTAFSKGRTLPPDQIISDGDVETQSIERRVKRKKGSWWQVPKDLQDHNDT
jgi:hypothetical protein